MDSWNTVEHNQCKTDVLNNYGDSMIGYVCVWSAVGNDSVPVGPIVRLVHPIRAPLPPQRAMWRGFGEARCPTIAGSDYPW